MTDVKDDNRGTSLFGDPLEFADYQFRLAEELCGDCREYHALWPYRRLGHAVVGIEASYELLRMLLRASMPPNGTILIAGCADAGLLALTVRALEGIPCAIAVADHCLTPLTVCRRYADQHGLSITTHEVDLTLEKLPARYDVILGHGSLRLLPASARAAYLAGVGKMLVPGGTLLQAEPFRISLPESPFANDAKAMLAVLRAQGIALPQDEAAFEARIARIAAGTRDGTSESLKPRELASLVDEAGLTLRVACEYRLKGTDAVHNPQLTNFGMQIAVALPVGSSL
jgi:hypothetical protein